MGYSYVTLILFYPSESLIWNMAAFLQDFDSESATLPEYMHFLFQFVQLEDMNTGIPVEQGRTWI